MLKLIKVGLVAVVMARLLRAGIVIFALITGSAAAFAGSADRSLDCKSASGRTTLKGVALGDSTDFGLTFTIDGKSINYLNTYNVDLVSYGYLSTRKPNYHFTVNNMANKQHLIFLAIPTEINIEQTNEGEKGSLKAYVVGTDPRSPDKKLSPTIELNCLYDYQI